MLKKMLVLLWSVSFVQCTALYGSVSAEQCNSDADCQGHGGLQDSVCDQQYHVCVIEAQAVAMETEGCTTTEMCTHENNSPSVCREPGQPCVNLQTEQCPIVSGNWQHKKALFVGSIAPHSYRQFKDGVLATSNYTRRLVQAMDLALNEWNDKSPSGLPQSQRPLAVVHCNSNGDAEQGQNVMTHLVDEVEAPVVLTATERDTAAVTPQAVASNTALVCIDCVGRAPATSEEAGLVWRVLPALEDQAPLVSWRVSELETKLRVERELAAETQLRVALFYQDYPGVNDFAEKVRGSLRFNGGDVAAAGEAFLELRAPDPREAEVQHVEFANQLIAFQPDIIVLGVGEDFETYYLPLLEQGWPDSYARPQYVLTYLNQDQGTLSAAVGDDDDLRERISGTGVFADEPLLKNLADFTSRFRAQYNQVWPDGTQFGYEAMYATAYGLVLTDMRKALDSGLEIANSFEHLAQGDTIVLGPSMIQQATTTLIGKKTIDLVGPGSYMNWDMATHDARSDVGMWCLSRDPDGDLRLSDNAGPRWSYETHEITGEYACP